MSLIVDKKTMELINPPKCRAVLKNGQICGKPMKNAYDSIQKKVNPRLWQPACKHNKNLRLSIG